jgi:peptidyl-prolyl cis-trans isomerase C
LRTRALLAGLLSASLVTVAVPRLFGDQDATEKARRAAVVAKVGPRVVTAGELEDRLAAVPRYQLTAFGNSREVIRRKFLDEVIVHEVLLSVGAEARHLDQQLTTAQALARAHSNATLRMLRAKAPPAESIPSDDVKKYYEDNRARYDSPERFSVWRILCKTREEAVAVLAAAKKEPTIPIFQALARDHSLDKATLMRGGNLGFVTREGTSNEAGLTVDPALVAAAASVKDGEFVATPVEEKGNFAVVWHRGTVGATHRSLQEVDAQIRDTLYRERIEEANKKLLDELRARDAKDVNEALLTGIDVSQSDGMVVPRRRPGQVAPLNAPAPPPKK